jgi:hypothetical protein
MSGPGAASCLQTLDIVAVIEPAAIWPWPGDASDHPATCVGVERLALDPEEPRCVRSRQPLGTLICDRCALIHESIMSSPSSLSMLINVEETKP